MSRMTEVLKIMYAKDGRCHHNHRHIIASAILSTHILKNFYHSGHRHFIASSILSTHNLNNFCHPTYTQTLRMTEAGKIMC
jgi:hypothetical protein